MQWIFADCYINLRLWYCRLLLRMKTNPAINHLGGLCMHGNNKILYDNVHEILVAVKWGTCGYSTISHHLVAMSDAKHNPCLKREFGRQAVWGGRDWHRTRLKVTLLWWEYTMKAILFKTGFSCTNVTIIWHQYNMLTSWDWWICNLVINRCQKLYHSWW